ncbi:MAG TPA: protein kinase [Kofleriaceae bacterium]
MDQALRRGAILLGKYRVDEVLGQGGMGVVLKVTHLQLGEVLAIKILLPHGAAQSETHARFMREAQSVARLRGEHVARMVDVGVLPDGSPYMLMEYLHGTDLAAELRRRAKLQVGEAVDYALQACAALAEAHANGIVHRDIKPGNLFLTTRLDGTPLVKILDFGISKDPSGEAEPLTQTQTMMGTPGYMSPEHMKATREVDARTDLWSLGVVLYESLSGHRPFAADSFSAVVIRVATEPPQPMTRDIPDALQRVVLRCLEKDRNARWPSAAELAASLVPFARDPVAAARAAEQARVLGRGPRPRTVPGADQGRPSATHRTPAVGQPSARPEPSQRRMPPPTTLTGSSGASRRLGKPRQLAYGRIVVAAGLLLGVIGGGVWLALRPGSGAGSGDGDAAKGSATRPAPVTPPVAMQPIPMQPIAVQPVTPPVPTPPIDPAAGSAGSATGSAGVATGSAGVATGSATGSAAEPAAGSGSDAIAATPPVADARPAPARPASPCDTLDLGDTIATAAKQYAGGSARSALALITKALDCRHSDNMYRNAGIYACGALDVRAAKLYYAKTSPQLQPQIAQKCHQVGLDLGVIAPAPATPAVACNTIKIDDVMSRAASHYAGGNAKLALSLTENALACQQNGRMYWLATMYACAAGDRAHARQYFRHVAAELQPKLEERCTQQHVIVRTP